MGSCMSCKAGKEAYAYTTSPPAHRFQSYCSMDDVLPIAETQNGVTVTAAKPGAKPETTSTSTYTRGQATLFGFKRRPATTPATLQDNNTATAPLSNGSSQESLSAVSPIQSGRSTPRLPRPKRDADGNQTVHSTSTALRPNRFGFRGPSLTNKVADLNRDIAIVAPITVNSNTTSNNNNNNNTNIVNNNSGTVEAETQGGEKPRSKGGGRNFVSSGIPRPKEVTSGIPVVSDSNRQTKRSAIPQPNQSSHATRFTLQTTLLPKPQYPVRLTSVDAEETESIAPTKTAKTAVNNRRAGRVGSASSGSREDGSDSGIGIGNGDSDTLHGIEQLEHSPSIGLRRKARHLEVVLGTNKSFDVREIKDKDDDDGQTVITEISVISLPKTNYRPASNKKPAIGSGIRRPFRYQGTGIPTYGNSGCRGADESSIATNSISSPSSEEQRDDDSCSLDTEEAKVFDDRAQNEKSARDLLSTGGGPEEDMWGPGEAMAEGYSSSEGGDDGPISMSATDNTNSSDDLSVSRLAARHHNLHHGRQSGFEASKRVTIEDTLFAAIAASSSATLIEDERSPADSMISSGSASSEASEDVSECLEPRSLVQDSDLVDSQQEKDADGSQKAAERPTSVTVAPHSLSHDVASPVSPGTPTNASNSLSLSEGRDFLIDDEIADQPGLTFGGSGTAGSGAVADLTSSSAGCSSLLLSVTENTTTLVDSSPRPVIRHQLGTLSAEGSPGPTRGRRLSRTGSVDTLSPCESIASDDLMLDYEQSEGSAFDCTAESRLDESLGGLHSIGDPATAISETDSRRLDSIREWTTVLGANMKEAALVAGRPSRAIRSRTGSTPTPTPDSPRSSVGTKASPLRPARQSSTSASGSDCEDGGLWLDRHTYHSICQDIVNHKTMLLKLLRHLQKNEENSLMRAETLNPFDSQLKNGLFYNLASADGPVGETDDTNQSPQEELADLRRQVVFLQQQLEDKERTIQLLQVQMTKYSDRARENSVHREQAETVNAATQTERLRPVSAGPSLLQSIPSDSTNGPLVSSSEVWLRRASVTASKLPAPTPAAVRVSKRASTGATQAQAHSHTPSSGIPTRRSQQPPVVTTKTS